MNDVVVKVWPFSWVSQARKVIAHPRPAWIIVGIRVLAQVFLLAPYTEACTAMVAKNVLVISGDPIEIPAVRCSPPFPDECCDVIGFAEDLAHYEFESLKFVIVDADKNGTVLTEELTE